jgi:hypothetical protein
MDIGERRVRLIGWLEVARKEVENLLLRHHIFEELQSIVRSNNRFASASGLFNEWVALSYAQSATVGVRRHLKVGDDSVSLKRCLEEIQNYPELVSRDFYIAFFFDSPEWVTSTTGHKYFDSISDKSGKHIAVQLVDKQLADLEASAGAIEHYVDRRIAHYDKRGLARPVPTFKDLEGVLRALESLVIFYWTLLKGSSLVGLTRTIGKMCSNSHGSNAKKRRIMQEAPNKRLETDLRTCSLCSPVSPAQPLR